MNADNIRTAAPRVSGCVFRAPKGTPVPTDASTPLPEAFKSAGYISEDGIRQIFGKSAQALIEMGGDAVKYVNQKMSSSMSYTPIELTAETAKVWVGDSNVEVVDKKVDVNIKPGDDDEVAYVYDMVGDDLSLIRVTQPRGVLTADVDIAWKKNVPIMSPVTLSSMKDSTGSFGHIYFQEA